MISIGSTLGVKRQVRRVQGRLLTLLLCLAVGVLWFVGFVGVMAAPATAQQADAAAPAVTTTIQPGQGGQSATVRLLGHIGGVPERVVTQGAYTYVATDYGVSIFNTSDPTQPRRTGFILLHWLEDISIAGDYLYVTLWEDKRLAIINVADPTTPRLVKEIALPGLPDGMILNGQLIYILSFLEGIQVVDVTNPAQAAVVASVLPNKSLRRGAMRGQYLYTTSHSIFRIFNITDPKHPVLTGEVGFGGRHIHSLLLAGDVAYLAQSDQTFVVDISNPAAPQMIGSLPIGNALLVDGNYLYATPPSNAKQLRIFTLSNPRQPVTVTTIPINYFITGLQINQQIATLTTDGGLLFFDLTTPTAPRLLHRWWGGSDIRQVALAGSYAFLRDGLHSELALVDLTNPFLPTPINALSVLSRSEGFAVQGNLLYVGRDCTFPCRSGFTLYSRPTPTTLREVGSYITPLINFLGGGPAQAFAFAGTRAYLATTGSGLRVVDVQNPTQPVDLGGYKENLDAVSIDVVEDTLYLIGANTLQQFNVANAAQPTLSASLPISYGRKFARQGNLLYIADSGRLENDAGLRIVDATAGAAPRQISQFFFEAARNANAIAVDGTLAFVTVVHDGSGIDTLRVIDVRDPAHPRQLDSFELSGSVASGFSWAKVHDVVAMNGILYVADGQGGLYLLGYPTSSGVDSRLAAPTAVPIETNRAVTVPIQINNSGLLTATGITINVTLAGGLQYVSCDLGEPVAQTATTLRWQLDNVAPFAPRPMNLAVALPTHRAHNATYKITAEIITANTDAEPANNTVAILLNPITDIKAGGDQFSYLPLITKTEANQ